MSEPADDLVLVHAYRVVYRCRIVHLSSQGSPPLIQAMSFGRADVVAYLVSVGATVISDCTVSLYPMVETVIN